MIERTFDYRKVKRLLNGEAFPITSNYFYLLERDGRQDLGLWTFHKHKDGLMIHANMTRLCRGKKAVESAVRAFRWAFEEGLSSIIYARIPKKNRAAALIANEAGMYFTHSDNNNRFFEVRKWAV